MPILRLAPLPMCGCSQTQSCSFAKAVRLTYVCISRQALGQVLASFPSPSHTAEDGGHVDWEGADFAILDICDTLRLMRAEPSLLKYLDALVGLRDSPFLPRCRQLTRLRLQAELYALTQVRPPDLDRVVSGVSNTQCPVCKSWTRW